MIIFINAHFSVYVLFIYMLMQLPATHDSTNTTVCVGVSVHQIPPSTSHIASVALISSFVTCTRV